MRADFVIIGAMKCATSTLHDQLARVPGVSMSEPKEPNFFSDEEQWAKGIGWYESLFASMPAGELKGESSTHYTKRPTYPECAERIAEHLPDAKLIYVMRDPLDRIVSQYIHEWSQRVIEDGCSIDRAIREYPFLIDYSRYAMQLEPYIERYGFDRILPVFFERLMDDPQTEFERIGRFLGISSPLQWHEDEARNVSAQRQRRSPLLDSVLEIKAFCALRRTLLPESLRAKLRGRWTMQERPQLSPESIEWLRGQLDEEMDTLGDWLGRPLSCSSFATAVMRGPSPEWSVGDNE